LAANHRGVIGERLPTSPSIETLGRLHAMGVLENLSEQPGQAWSYVVRSASVPILKEIADNVETPLRVLAATLLADDRNTALKGAHPTLVRLFSEEAASVGIRQARLVAHEVRNSLVPVQVALEGLFRALEGDPSDGIDRYRGRIEDGVNRVFKFVDETLRALTVAAEPAESFDVASALGDALESFTTAEVELSRTIPASGALPPIVGARGRFVLAIVNVVRNAVQAVPDRKPQVAIAATLAPDARSIVITVDDDGPGVPAAHRKAIFGRGFSLRPGGTGMGLALTREVVEQELGGKVACTDNPLGGARFEITVPIIGEGAQ
jgi:signal transduction histidine kinase